MWLCMAKPEGGSQQPASASFGLEAVEFDDGIFAVERAKWPCFSRGFREFVRLGLTYGRQVPLARRRSAH